MANSKKPKNLNDMMSADVGAGDLQEIVAEIRQTSDRTAAIVLGSLVEWTVEQRVLAALPRHDDKTAERLLARDGPLSGFYAKNQMGYALGAYDETILRQLEIIRKMRNVFAHSVLPIHFETQEIIDQVKKLHTGFLRHPIELADLSEYRRTFTVISTRIVTYLRFNSVGLKLDLYKQVLEAVHQASPDKVPREILDPIVDVVEKLKGLKLDDQQ
jgi:DNA-binding MltR family transcriptional regulator